MKKLIMILFVGTLALADDHVETKQLLTLNLVNGKMWIEMDEPMRAFYVSAYLQGYLVACMSSAGFNERGKSCYERLGSLEHTNPANPREIVEGVTRVYEVPANRILIIPCAIQAASMKANGASQASVDKYLEQERKSFHPEASK